MKTSIIQEPVKEEYLGPTKPPLEYPTYLHSPMSEQEDKARLERYVLAAMAGESCATYRGTDWEWATHILNYAIRMMKAVDNYKPEQP